MRATIARAAGHISVRYYFLPCLLLCVNAFAAPTQVPGTRVAMDVPASFTLAPDFPGFVSSGVQATIAVSELPSSFIDATETYDDLGLKRNGIDVVARETFEHEGLRAILIDGEQIIRERRVAKLILLTGDVTESLMITATYFKKDEGKIAAQLRETLRQAVWDPSEPLDHYGGLDFRLKEIPGLRVATRASNSIIFTEEGRLPDRFYTGAMLVVGWSTGDTSTVKNKRHFAHSQFANIQLLNRGEIENTEFLQVDDQEAIEVTGSGRHKHLGYDINAYQLIVVYDDRYLMAQGFANGNDAEVHFDLFRTIMNSLSTE